jgi:UDP-N-acetyl-D-glucosamine dehydrogenase
LARKPNTKLLIDKIKAKQAKVGIIGLGYVGLPEAIYYAEAGFRVTGFDVAKERVAKLNRGESYIGDVSNERLMPLVQAGNFHATYDMSVLAAQDVILVCVPTPVNRTQDPDLSFIKSATSSIAEYLQRDQLIVLESSTYPGTTEEIMLPLFAAKGLEVGRDFYLAFSPERIDPGNTSSKGWNFNNMPKVIGGVTPACLEVAITLYSQVVQQVIPVSSPRVAEMTKLFENIFRAVNIALVNEMALLCDRMGVNTWEVLEAANTKPFGIMKFTPGPGLGGHCIPVDPFYLTWKAREYDFHTRFIELAGEINNQMPYHVRELIIRALSNQGRGLQRANLLILGLAYKKDVADYRESPALKIIPLLEKDGAIVHYNDPYIPEFSEHGLKMQSVALTEERLQTADVVIILTDHSNYDYSWIVANSKKVVDTRNAAAKVTQNRDKIELL